MQLIVLTKTQQARHVLDVCHVTSDPSRGEVDSMTYLLLRRKRRRKKPVVSRHLDSFSPCCETGFCKPRSLFVFKRYRSITQAAKHTIQ